MKRIVLVSLALTLSCMGPDMGPQGPEGPQGPAGPSGAETQLLPQLNSEIADGGAPNLQFSAVSTRLTQDFVVPNNTFTVMPYGQNVEYDRQQEFNPASHGFTARRAGEYQVCASAGIDTAVMFELDIFKNGSRYKVIASSLGQRSATGCGTIALAAGDYIDIQVFQQSPAAHTFYGDPFWNWLSIHRLQ